jgi:2-iminobutanoate/2-iminopropanoate deaminase
MYRHSMNQRDYIHPTTWAPTPGFSHGVSTGGGRLLFISGQVPTTGTGEASIVGVGDFQAQVQQTFDNLQTVLQAAGARFSDVVKMNYFVVGLTPERLRTVREVRNRYLPASERPASTLVGVSMLFDEQVMIEIEAVAELPPIVI